jgi:hypothetical protein
MLLPVWLERNASGVRHKEQDSQELELKIQRDCSYSSR